MLRIILWLSCLCFLQFGLRCDRDRGENEPNYLGFDFHDEIIDQNEEAYRQEMDLEEKMFKFYRKQGECKRKPEFQYTKLDCILTIQTMKAMVNFYLANTDKIIADGLFGLRLAQGPLQYITNKMEKSNPFYSVVKSLSAVIGKTADTIYEKVKRRGLAYDVKFLKVIDRPESFQRDWRNANTSLIWKKRDAFNGDFSEKSSDRCIGKVLGSNKDSTKKCVFSKKCLELETRPHTKGYFLTHQLLYFVAGYTHGCKDEIVKAFESEQKMNSYFDTVAANIYDELRQTDIGRGMEKLDIFTEQGAICSMLGVVECTQRLPLYDVMNFVDSNGCVTENRKFRRRRKREDVLIDGCSQHTGATILGYLANQLKIMLVPPPCHMLK